MKIQDLSKKTTQIVYSEDPDKILEAEFGPRYRTYRMLWELADSMRIAPTFPLEIGFDLKFACNLKCIGCYFQGGEKKLTVSKETRKDFPFDKYLQLLREGQKNDLYSVYFGYASEPTMNRRFLDYVAECRAHDVMDIWFGTNATTMTEFELDQMIKLGVTRFLVSVDASTRETYEQVRIGGDFERVENNIRYLAARRKELGSKLPIIRLSYVINKINEHEIEDFHRKWSGIADYISVQNFYDIGEHSTEKLGVRLERNATYACQQPFQRMFVHPDGKTFPCCSFENVYSDELAETNLFEQGAKAVWNGEKFQALRRDLLFNRFNKYECCIKCAATSWKTTEAE